MAMRGVRWLTLLAAVALGGCGGGAPAATTAEGPPPEPREVWVSLNNFEGPEHAGLMMAEANGYFAAQGLEVRLGSPTNPSRPIRYVLSGTSDIGVSHLPQVAISQENEKPIVAVGSLIAQPTAAMIWLKGSGIKRISNLKGKTIAIPGLPFQKELLRSVLARSGLKLTDVNVKLVSYESVPVLAGGRADAIFGGSGNVEGAELRSLGLDPVIVPVHDLGVPPYDELVLFVTRDRLAGQPQLVRDFLVAVARGTAAAVRNPRRAADVVVNGIEPNPRASREGIRVGVEATLPLLSESGEMDPDQAQRLLDWMQSEKMIRRAPPVSELLTDEYLSQP
jgi:putative hydroxymethylpyrimidine transport system substrate-binding protein